MENELFDICCERDSQPADQQRRLKKLLTAGADAHAADKNGVTRCTMPFASAARPRLRR
jgi:hypothetical protein